jgi:hypothetical protein
MHAQTYRPVKYLVQRLSQDPQMEAGSQISNGQHEVGYNIIMGQLDT